MRALWSWLAIVIGVIFLGIYSRWIASEMHAMSDALTAAKMALAREQKLTDLGGVVAAAAMWWRKRSGIFSCGRIQRG